MAAIYIYVNPSDPQNFCKAAKIWTKVATIATVLAFLQNGSVRYAVVQYDRRLHLYLQQRYTEGPLQLLNTAIKDGAMKNDVYVSFKTNFKAIQCKCSTKPRLAFVYKKFYCPYNSTNNPSYCRCLMQLALYITIGNFVKKRVHQSLYWAVLQKRNRCWQHCMDTS